MKKWISPREVEKVYSIPVGSLANRRCLGLPPAYVKCGSKKILYSVEDLEKWLESQKVRVNGLNDSNRNNL